MARKAKPPKSSPLHCEPQGKATVASQPAPEMRPAGGKIHSRRLPPKLPKGEVVLDPDPSEPIKVQRARGKE